MKKNTLFISAIFCSAIGYAQVGINTTSPKATLDVIGKNGSTDTDGLIAPRLTRAELSAKGNSLYGSNQNGAIIYITDVSGGDILSQRVNITTPGYYYFDSNANQWKSITGSGTTSSTEPWNVANTTTPASNNSQDIYQMGKIGIFNNTPLNILHLKSSSSLTSSIGSTNYVQGMITTGDTFPGSYIELNKATSSGSRVLKQWIEEQTYSGTPRGVYQWQTVSDNAQSVIKQLLKADLLSGNIGIGPAFQPINVNPQVSLDVDGNVFARKGLSIGYAVADSYTANNDTWLNIGGIAGDTKPLARFSISNCGAPCGQGTANNIILNNVNNTNPLFGSLAYSARGGNLSDFTPATELIGIDRDASNNYGGLSIRTRNATNYGDRFLVRSSGRVEIRDVGTVADNTLTKILAVNSSGQVGYVDKAAVSSANQPWLVTSSTNQPTSNIQNIYQNANIGIGDFSTDNPTANLDVKGSIFTRTDSGIGNMLYFNPTAASVPDVLMKRTSANNLQAEAVFTTRNNGSTGTVNLQSFDAVADLFPSFAVNKDGVIVLGSGDAATDVRLSRGGANLLRAQNTTLAISRTGTIDTTPAIRLSTNDLNSISNPNPMFEVMVSGKLRWGAGTTNIPDINLERDAATSKLKLTGTAYSGSAGSRYLLIDPSTGLISMSTGSAAGVAKNTNITSNIDYDIVIEDLKQKLKQQSEKINQLEIILNKISTQITK